MYQSNKRISSFSINSVLYVSMLLLLSSLKYFSSSIIRSPLSAEKAHTRRVLPHFGCRESVSLFIVLLHPAGNDLNGARGMLMENASTIFPPQVAHRRLENANKATCASLNVKWQRLSSRCKMKANCSKKMLRCVFNVFPLKPLSGASRHDCLQKANCRCWLNAVEMENKF